MEVYRYTSASYWVDCVLKSHFAMQFPSRLIGDTMEGFRDVVCSYGHSDCPTRTIFASTAYDSMYRVLCLTHASDREKDLRHWHEHGDDGAGVRIRIDLPSIQICDRRFVLAPVEYGNIPTEYVNAHDIKLTETEQAQSCFAFWESTKWLFRKREVFAWEEEIRIVASALSWENVQEYRRLLHPETDKAEDRKYIDFITVGGAIFPGRIVGVDFGWKHSLPSVQRDIKAVLPHNNNLKFRIYNSKTSAYDDVVM